MIVATAGHVDHGKTSLVRTLTHIDTDRLEEEKRRGMSIDIGFAHADLGGGQAIGFVDVPGHERFMRNMLAGVACIDMALLVVAADDGPMPQTREHLAILQLLGVERCAVALTKIDRVSAERATEAAREIDALLADGPHAGAPVFPLVATGGEGIDALRGHLARVDEDLPRRRIGGHFRLVVDRSFLLAGNGRVVTGAVLSGSVRVGDSVVVSPGGSVVRVRGIQVHSAAAARASAGERCALNLAGAELKDAAPIRGDWVVAGPAHAPSDRLDVRLACLRDAPREIPTRAALQLHIGATMVETRVAVLEGASIACGGEGFAQLVLARPVSALHGDRFILRDAAAGRTVGGGRVVDPFAPTRGRSRPERLVQLAAHAMAEPRDALDALLATTPLGVDSARFALARNLDAGSTLALFERAPDDAPSSPSGSTAVTDRVERIEVAGVRLAFSATHWQALTDRILAALARWHAEQPDSTGPAEPALAAAAGLANLRPLLHAVVESLEAGGRVAREGLRCRLAAHRPALAAADAALLEKVGDILRPAGLRPPIIGELASALDMPPPALLEFLQRASRLGLMVGVAPNRYYMPETVDALVAAAGRLAIEAGSGGFDAAAFRDRTGIGRNLTVQVLEFMDREGVTRFDGSRRTPVAPGQAPPGSTGPAARPAQ